MSQESYDTLAEHYKHLEWAATAMLDALILIRGNERGESYSAGVAMGCIASLDDYRKAHEEEPRRGSVPRFLPHWLGGHADRVDGHGVALRTHTPECLEATAAADRAWAEYAAKARWPHDDLELRAVFAASEQAADEAKERCGCAAGTP